MTITYIYQTGLYINMTNKCTNNCEFCVRTQEDGIYGSDNLWLEREPTREEVLKDIKQHDLDQFNELVFCGYGEPTSRLYDMLWICREVKNFSNIQIRVNTNGHANLIYDEDVTPLFKGAVDIVSISLNTANAEDYQRVCRSKFGENSYFAMLKFAKDVKKYVSSVILSVVKDSIPDAEIEKCRGISQNLGVELRVRDMIDSKNT